MSEESSPRRVIDAGWTSSRATCDLSALASLFNAVTAGLGGLYVSTGSIVVTAIAAGLVALLGLCVMVGGGRSS
jgi:hypothetical protein